MKIPTSATESHPCADADALRAEVPRFLTQGRLDRALWSLARGDALCPAGSVLSATLRQQVQAEVESTRAGGAFLEDAKAAGDRGDRVAAQRLRAQAAAAFEREVGAARAVAFAHERGMPHVSPEGSYLAIERQPTMGFSPTGRVVRAPPGAPLVITDVDTGQERLALPNHRFLTFAKRGLVALNLSEGRAELWDILQGKRLWIWSAPIIQESDVVAASANDRWLLLRSSERQFVVLDTESERQRLLSVDPSLGEMKGVRVYPAMSDDGSRAVVAFSQLFGTLGALGWFTSLSLYDTGSGTAVANFSSESKAFISNYALSKDGMWLAIAREKEVQVYSIGERKIVSRVACGPRELLQTLGNVAFAMPTCHAFFTEDSRQLWVSAGKKTFIYDVTTQSRRQIATPPTERSFGEEVDYRRVKPLANGELFTQVTESFGPLTLFRSRDGKRMASGQLAGEVGNAVFLVDSEGDAAAIVRVDRSGATRRDVKTTISGSPVVSPNGAWIVGDARSCKVFCV